MLKSVLSTARSAALVGLVVSTLILVLWLLGSGIDRLGLASLVTRIVHIFGAVLWVGMIWFVNFIQLAAIADTDDAGRATLMKHIVPKVAHTFRHASHLTVISGFAMLATSGYLFDRWVYQSTVYIPPLKFVILYGAVLAALVMWALVHLVIWPSLQLVLGLTTGSADAKAQARNRIRIAARINLILALPVTLIMITAAHV